MGKIFSSMKVPDFLYHYTSIESLLSIINGIDVSSEYLKFRSTHIAYLNDLTEGRLLQNALKLNGLNENLIKILESCKGYPFVMSLSENSDDLNMWRCYACSGVGAAIGFDYQLLHETFTNLKKCEYTTIEELSKRFSHMRNPKEGEDCMPLSRLLSESYYYKHISFKSENEWRVFDYSFPDGYRQKSDVIIPYKEIRVPVSAITSITFGPKCDACKNGFAIMSLLKSKMSANNVSNIEIKQSLVPLN